MISEMAMEDCELLISQGFKLTPRDIVRLNALGCKCEKNPNASSFYALPRCVFLDDEIVFREPTIGHNIWFDSISQHYNTDDSQTLFMLKAYSLSMDQEDLPKWNNLSIVEKEIQKFIKRVSKYTIKQIMSCIDYVINGSNPLFNEEPILDKDDKVSEFDKADFKISFPVGIIRNAQALGLGISLKDAYSMTESDLQNAIQRAYEIKGFEVDKDIKNVVIGEYYATLRNIKKELSNG